MILQSVRTTYKLLRDTELILLMHFRIAPPMEILLDSRLNLTRCDDSTNSNNILTECEGAERLKM